MNQLETLRAGRKILDEIMLPHGFIFVAEQFGKSCGGDYACGEYVRGDRKLEIHFRFSLGLVTYHIGALTITHQDYMRALLGKNGANKYPGFSDDPLDAFRDLKYDLANFCNDFLDGKGEELERCVTKAREQPKGFRALG